MESEFDHQYAERSPDGCDAASLLVQCPLADVSVTACNLPGALRPDSSDARHANIKDAVRPLLRFGQLQESISRRIQWWRPAPAVQIIAGAAGAGLFAWASKIPNRTKLAMRQGADGRHDYNMWIAHMELVQ
ncbi:hypothetical protein PCL_07288 [Purpureocillium lilacinum]|uniref:Uncharacterized protein n=1 Tax=Purpureocillium lilacinum TaxID=33203 RepID=A0A2U3DSL0_PURLI|nr:hypothetical protein PCL_07288 [Purpureocillium lilacinum]